MRTRTVIMFLAGAVIGFFIIWYYVDLFGFFNYRSSRGTGLAIGAAGAIALGIICTLFIRGVAIFAAATLIGYVVVVFGWLAYAAVFDIGDREGGKGMGMIFILGPAAGAVVGLIATALLSRRELSSSS